MTRIHRLVAALSVLLLAYVVVTGLGIQLADMRALLSHAPETDPDMLMMRQHIDGPPNYAVVSAPDYTAPALPPGLDHVAALHRAAALGAASRPGRPLRLVELRMVEGAPAGHVQMGDDHLIFSMATGRRLPAAALPPPEPPRDFPAPRASFKFLHRMNYLGGIGPAFDGLASIALSALIVTGLAQYWRIYRMRRSLGRRNPFWSAGERWRRLHRWTAVAASLPVLWLTLSGLALAIDNVGAFIHGVVAPPSRSGPSAFEGDQSTPLRVGEIAAMTRTTLAAFRKAEPATGIKVLRLRYFAGYPQGVVVAADDATTQLVFDAATGAPMRMWEKGYPDLNFPSGWDWHQRLKRLHRGDIAGLPGRWFELASGLSLLFFIVSGTVMYVQLWRRRRRAGRPALIWL